MATPKGTRVSVWTASDKQGSVKLKGFKAPIYNTPTNSVEGGFKVNPLHSRPELTGAAAAEETKAP